MDEPKGTRRYPWGSVFGTGGLPGRPDTQPSGRRSGLTRWREELFAFMYHKAQRPGAYFQIPSAQIMEIGIEFEI
jgi:KUP system potassium uptake protein